MHGAPERGAGARSGDAGVSASTCSRGRACAGRGGEQAREVTRGTTRGSSHASTWPPPSNRRGRRAEVRVGSRMDSSPRDRGVNVSDEHALSQRFYFILIFHATLGPGFGGRKKRI